MKRKILVIMTIIMAIILTIGGCTQGGTSTSGGKTEPITLNVLHFLSGASTNIHRVFEFIDYANSRSNGELFLNYRGGSEVIATAEAAEAVRNGVVDIAFVPSTYYESIVPEAILLSLSEQDEHGLHRYADERKPGGVYDFVQAGHEREGLYFLGRGSLYASSWLFTNQEVKSLSDLSNLKVAVPGPSFLNFIKALGASPTSIPSTDQYSALERGVVDSLATVVSVAYRNKMYEVLDYIISPPFKTNVAVTCIVNLDTWNSLPVHLQDLLTEDIIEQESKVGIYWLGLDAYSLTSLQAAGMKIIELPPDDAKRYQEIFVEELWKDVQSKVSPEMYEQMKELSKR